MNKHQRKPISPELLAQLAAAKKQPKKREWHWSLTVTIAGSIGGSILMLAVKSFTMMSYLDLFLGVLIFAVLAFVVQWKFFYSPKFIQKHFRLPLGVYALYCFGGIAIPIMAVLLTVNWVGASSTEETERHRIVGFDRTFILDSNALAVFLLENDAYRDDPAMRSKPYLEAIQKGKLPFLDIKYRKGLLGFNIFEGTEMSPDPKALIKEVREEKTVQEEEPAVEPDSTQTDTTVAVE